MALYAMADNGVDIPAARDAALYNVMVGGADFVIAGIHNELAMTYNPNSFIVSLGTGEAVICGRHVTEVTENGVNTNLELSPSDSGYVVLRFDLTKPAGQEAYLAATNILNNDNLNSGGTVHDLLLYQYVTNNVGVVSMTDLRSVRQTINNAVAITGTLIAGSWSSNVYTFTNPAIETGKKILISEADGCTDNEFNAFVNGLLRITAVNSGQITIKAMRVQPTINLPIQLLIMG